MDPHTLADASLTKSHLHSSSQHEGGGRGRGYRGETNTLWQNMDDQSLTNKIKFLT